MFRETNGWLAILNCGWLGTPSPQSGTVLTTSPVDATVPSCPWTPKVSDLVVRTGCAQSCHTASTGWIGYPVNPNKNRSMSLKNAPSTRQIDPLFEGWLVKPTRLVVDFWGKNHRVHLQELTFKTHHQFKGTHGSHHQWFISIHVQQPTLKTPSFFCVDHYLEILPRVFSVVIVLPAQRMHYYKGNPSKLPHICIVWFPQNG